MACMFQTMHDSRIGVGISAAAIGWRGFEIARDYANARRQGRALVNNDPNTPAVPIAQHPDVKRMLLKAKAQSEAALLMCLYTAKVAESAEPNAFKLTSLLTPMTKSWPAKYALEANDLAIQVLGGAGYTQDWIAEKLYRDNRLNAIHEGTHGIQGLDLMGRKVFADQGAGLVLLLQRIADTAQRAVHSPRLADIAPSALEAGSALAQAVLPLAARLPDGQADMAFANASLFLDALGTVVACWLSLDLALCAQEKAHPQAGIWVAQARYLHLYELPQSLYVAGLLKHVDRTVLDAPL
jgi:Acyl-CoA dehydrogenase, C-terminal domain/Acetyl-CoA dehydrogenase C-terminal like